MGTKQTSKQKVVSPETSELVQDKQSNYDPNNYEPVNWRERAACKGKRDLFFPAFDERSTSKDSREVHAKFICNSCVVMDQCRQYAISNDEQYGIWGGKSEEELRKIRLRN